MIKRNTYKSHMSPIKINTMRPNEKSLIGMKLSKHKKMNEKKRRMCAKIMGTMVE